MEEAMLSEVEFHDICIKLRFYGKIQPNQKVMVTGNRIVDASSNYWAFMRWINGENRNITLKAFDEIIKKVNEIYQKLPIKQLSDVITDMSDALKGVLNLRTTYKDDQMFVAEIECSSRNAETLINEMKARLLRLSMDGL